MDEESQVYPLAPARIHQRSDEELAATKPNTYLPKQQRSSKCFVYVLLAVVLLCIAILVFALTVLRVSSPQAKLSSVSIKTPRYVTGQSPSLNATMTGVMTVKNDNFGGFKFANSDTRAIVLYGEVTIGDMKISKRRVRARKTDHVNVTVQVRSNGLLFGDQNFISDINSGMLKLSSYAKLRGEVPVMHMINTHRTVVMNCSMSLNFTSRAFQDLLCM